VETVYSSELYDVTTEKTIHFIITVVRTLICYWFPNAELGATPGARDSPVNRKQ
jgi:hypothetical protein